MQCNKPGGTVAFLKPADSGHFATNSQNEVYDKIRQKMIDPVERSTIKTIPGKRLSTALEYPKFSRV